MNEENILKKAICRLFKQSSWVELNYAFYMWGPRRKFRDAHIWVHNRIWPHNIVKIEQLSPDWHDRDGVMFHAIFQILVDFVEKERPFQPSYDDNDKPIKRLYSPQEMRDFMTGWLGEDAVEKQIKSYVEQGWTEEDARRCFSCNRQYQNGMELISIYEWYKFKRPHLPEYVFNIARKKRTSRNSDDLFDVLDKMEDEYDEKTNYVNEKFITNTEYFDIQEERDMVDDVMMYKLLALRKSLWT